MTYQIVTDSACNLPEEIIDKFGLEVLSLTFYMDDNEYISYLKGQHTDIKQFYTMMRGGKVIKTSLPHLSTMEKTFRSILDKGKDILYLGFSSALSGTYEAAVIILNQLKTEYPDRTILFLNTFAASAGEGLLVCLCAEKAQKGERIQEVYDFALATRDHVCHWLTVDDLKYLVRGGRIPKTAGIAGQMLDIKPIIHVNEEGALIPVEKVRGRKKSIKTLVKHMKESAIEPENQTVFITHGDCMEDVTALKNMIKEELGVKHFVVNYIDPVIGAHSGPGTVALFFIGTKK